jgi:hypothetical protein
MADHSRIRNSRIIPIFVALGALCLVVAGLGKANRLRLSEATKVV